MNWQRLTGLTLIALGVATYGLALLDLWDPRDSRYFTWRNLVDLGIMLLGGILAIFGRILSRERKGPATRLGKDLSGGKVIGVEEMDDE